MPWEQGAPAELSSSCLRCTCWATAWYSKASLGSASPVCVLSYSHTSEWNQWSSPGRTRTPQPVSRPPRSLGSSSSLQEPAKGWNKISQAPPILQCFKWWLQAGATSRRFKVPSGVKTRLQQEYNKAKSVCMYVCTGHSKKTQKKKTKLLKSYEELKRIETSATRARAKQH